MNTWRRITLGEVAESVDYGVTASASPIPNGPKFLRITDIQNGSVNWDTVPWCECDAKTAAGSRLETGDIVFARTGATTGKSFLIDTCPKDAVFASYLIRVRMKDDVEPRYVSNFFQSEDYWAQITRGSRGAAQPGVNATTLKALEIPIPPFAEQRRIAAILDQADALRAKRREALAQLDNLTQSIFIEMFGDPVSNPKGWALSDVGTLCELQGGLQVSAARKGLPIEVPYLRVANVYRGRLDLTEIKTIHATAAEIARTTLVVGDLLIVEGHGNQNEVGRSALWTGEISQCIHQNHIIRVRFDDSKILPTFACEYLNSPTGRRHLLRAAKTTSGLNTINASNVRGTPMSVPPISIQQTFATRIQSVEALKATHRVALKELDRLFASLQHRAFSGEL